jgi:hypothetical protein
VQESVDDNAHIYVMNVPLTRLSARITCDRTPLDRSKQALAATLTAPVLFTPVKSCESGVCRGREA